MIKSIPSDFKKQYEVEWYHTTFATVAVDEIDVSDLKEKSKADREIQLFSLLSKLSEPIEEEVLPYSEIVEITDKSKGVCRDADDDKFIACALSASADIIVTGDKNCWI